VHVLLLARRATERRGMAGRQERGWGRATRAREWRLDPEAALVRFELVPGGKESLSLAVWSVAPEKSARGWAPREVEWLTRAVDARLREHPGCRIGWPGIARTVPGRSAQSCQDQWKKMRGVRARRGGAAKQGGGAAKQGGGAAKQGGEAAKQGGGAAEGGDVGRVVHGAALRGPSRPSKAAASPRAGDKKRARRGGDGGGDNDEPSADDDVDRGDDGNEIDVENG